MKNIICTVLTVVLLMMSVFAVAEEINVISREDGSGTRGAFIELFGIEQKNEAGEKIDYTTDDCDITNSTSVMMTTVAGNDCAIGYISLGSMNDTVKALMIDGAQASVENIKQGTYNVARPFNIAVMADISDAAADFVAFIMSADGQAVIEENGYIAVVESAPQFEGSKESGKIVIAGSSSVTPVMEKLAEAYMAINPNAEIELQQSDSSSGMTSALDGVCDIGMASRALKDSEIEAGLIPMTIAMDGIAVIVSNDNPVDGLTREQVRDIYMGVITQWSEIDE
ncbi:MAG: substrate-binding domain-containing protein [Clostridia bacterium]|nr:substrate-binding domain-containing protein [Clostridia bacterium]MBQ9856822.1 substrate-binding domain-containing protein [Clostridia bacterium]